MSLIKINKNSDNNGSDPLFDDLSKPSDAETKNQPVVNNVDAVPYSRIKKIPEILPSGSALGRLFHGKLTRKEFTIGSVVFVILLGSFIAFGLDHKAAAPTTAAKTAENRLCRRDRQYIIHR